MQIFFSIRKITVIACVLAANVGYTSSRADDRCVGVGRCVRPLISPFKKIPPSPPVASRCEKDGQHACFPNANCIGSPLALGLKCY